MRTKFNLLLPIILGLIVCLTTGAVFAQNPNKVEITASVNSDKIGLDDVLIYTLTFKGVNNPTQPRLSYLKEFKVVQTSRSSEFRFVNGVSSYYTNFIYYLTPQKTGTLTIPPLKYQHQGQQVETRPFKIEVVKGSVAPPTSRQQGRRRPPSIFDQLDRPARSPFNRNRQRETDVKLKTEVSKRNVLIGESVTFRVLLLTRNSIRSVNMLSNQSFPGFWQEWFPVSRSIDGEQKAYDGKIYQVFEIRKAVLFPTQSGDVTIPALKFEMSLADDPFSVFSGDRRIQRSTPEVTLKVSPLPGEALGLPVGDFTFTVKPDKKTVDVNDILTLRLKLRSKSGNVKTLELPQYTTTEYYKVFPAKLSRDTSFNGDNLTGVVDAETPVSFKTTGLISFPALKFKYFNPRSSKVITLSSRPFSINVVGAKEKQQNAESVPRTEIIKTGEDIDFIKTGEIHHQENHYYTSRLFTLLLVIFFLLNLLFLLKLHVYDRWIAGSSMLNKKRLLGKTINQLRQVREYGGIHTVLEDYLKEKTGLGLSEINNHSIEALFSKHQVTDSDIEHFLKIKTDSELYRFAPSAVSGGSARAEGKKLKHDVNRLIEILKRIDKRIDGRIS